MAADFDIIVIGAGHNGLVCAGYLAKAGYRVGVVERRHIVGGAVVTEEIVPGFHFDLGGSAHMLINHTPIVDDLRLTRYGLEYIPCDPIFFAPFPDGSQITIWRDIDKTCESIAAVCPEDAEAYRAYVNRWWDLAEGMVESFLAPPTVPNLFKSMVVGSQVWRNPIGQMRQVLRPYGDLLNDSFKDPRTRAVIAWMAGQTGPPPREIAGAPLAMWFPMYHISGYSRPVGGSGALTQALARMIEDHGGSIMTSQPVKHILTSGGRAVGIETEHGVRLIAGKAVVSAAHIRLTMKMLGNAAPPRAHRRVQKARTGNGIGMITRYAMHELPDYIAAPSNGQIQPHHQALQMICPSVEYLDRAYQDYLEGRPSREPALAIMTVSAVDPTLAPPGKHVMYLWGQYYPYELASGENWDDIAKRESD